jgi:protein-tyrosine phosphatase
VATAPVGRSSWIEPGRLLAGSYPADVDPLVDAGVTLVVDLTEEGERPSYTERLPAGVAHTRLPIRDFACATPDQMRATLDAIDAELDRGGLVFVHCLGGCGRTGAVAGCWLVRHGSSGAEALARLGGRCPETPEQRQLVRDWPRGS